jgi:hypothetical protein
VLENRLLRRILGPKREEVARDWRKLHNKVKGKGKVVLVLN